MIKFFKGAPAPAAAGPAPESGHPGGSNRGRKDRAVRPDDMLGRLFENLYPGACAGPAPESGHPGGSNRGRKDRAVRPDDMLGRLFENLYPCAGAGPADASAAPAPIEGAGQDHAGQDRAGQDRAGQDPATQAPAVPAPGRDGVQPNRVRRRLARRRPTRSRQALSSQAPPRQARARQARPRQARPRQAQPRQARATQARAWPPLIRLAVMAALALWTALAPGPAALAAEPELERLRRPSRAAREAKPDGAGAAARTAAMREAALGSAVQAGARWRYERIVREAVMPNAALLDSLFDFEPLMGRKGRLVVIPPVASGAGEALRLETERSATSQLGSYRLIRGARLASIAPHWRHYLLELPDGPSGIHPSLHPRSAEESGRWRVWVDRGWELGVRRADELFGLNVSNLARDYAGMMLFRRLVAERLATGPVTAESLSEMVVGEDEIVFDRKLWRLTEDGRFAVPERSGAAGRRRFAWPPGP